MPRNTFLLILGLTVVATLLLGFNLGRKFQASPGSASLTSPTPSVAIPKTLTYTNAYCGISLEYPADLTRIESTSSAVLSKVGSPTNESIVIICQKDIPRPPMEASRSETLQLGSVSAQLYHDSSSQDGSPIDKLIFHQPMSGLDVFIAGFGQTFNSLLKTVKILP